MTWHDCILAFVAIVVAVIVGFAAAVLWAACAMAGMVDDDPCQ